jgi:hypothetical protein
MPINSTAHYTNINEYVTNLIEFAIGFGLLVSVSIKNNEGEDITSIQESNDHKEVAGIIKSISDYTILFTKHGDVLKEMYISSTDNFRALPSLIEKVVLVVTDTYTVFVYALHTSSIYIVATSGKDEIHKAKGRIKLMPLRDFGLEFLKKSIEMRM